MAMFSKLSALLFLTFLASCGNDKGNAPSLRCSNCRIFVTAATTTGNTQGVAGADALCMADVNKPADGEYKAALTDFTYRGFDVAGWVYYPSTNYYRPDGTFISKTNALAQLFPPLTNAISTLNVSVWVGGDPHCNFWGDGTAGATSRYGTANATDGTYASAASQNCSNTSRLYCVEQ